MYDLPIFFIVDGLSAGGAGAHLLPTSVGNVAGSLAAGIVSLKRTRSRGYNLNRCLLRFWQRLAGTECRTSLQASYRETSFSR